MVGADERSRTGEFLKGPTDGEHASNGVRFQLVPSSRTSDILAAR
jgi:hypothetical protein